LWLAQGDEASRHGAKEEDGGHGTVFREGLDNGGRKRAFDAVNAINNAPSMTTGVPEKSAQSSWRLQTSQ